MRLPLLLVTVAACQASAVDGVDVYEETAAALFCGTHEPSANGKMLVESRTDAMPHADDKTAHGGVIDVYVHVVNEGPTVAQGDVSIDSIENQIRVLDAAFAPAGFSFRLAGVDRTTNRAWFTMPPGSDAEKAAKSALRKGGARDLNLYTAQPGNGFAGYATFPVDYKARPYADGVVMLHSVLPGGGTDRYDLGDQTVHQVGHWLGLYHTYQDSCDDGPGDLIADTPASSQPAFGCPVGRDTCGHDDSMDPVRNYMDATDDLCMNTFTAGQRARLDRQFAAFRRY